VSSSVSHSAGVATTPYDVQALRATEFPWAARGDAIYLNNASTGPLPARTVAAVQAFTALRAEPWRITQQMQFGTLDRTRELVARLVGASPAEIAVATNTSFGINLAARALPLGRGDVIVSADREFPANVYPWMALERATGAVTRRVPVRGGVLDEAGVMRALDAPNVKALALAWVSFETGYQADLAALGAACRERGIYFVVDAIQGLGAATLDVGACHIDVLACGAQKWLLSPWGSGFVYVRRELVRTMEPNAVSWMAVRDSDDFTRLTDYDFTLRDDARRFEQVTLPFQEFAGMNASLELLLELGPEAVAAHVQRLATRIVEWATDRGDMRLVTPADPARRAGIVAVAPPDPVAASARLAAAGVAHSVREGAIRLAPHCYNTEDEVDRALAVLGGG
jgi:cysteine desulfurase/selenocysteine lyase